jgi:hypothetical protein
VLVLVCLYYRFPEDGALALERVGITLCDV